MYTIPDLLQQFSKQKINKAKKLRIRELEETEKNHFVCFADDETVSYDVAMVLDPKSEITGYSCECGSNDFCLHLLAMGMSISESRTVKTTSQRGAGKKMSETEAAVEDINPEELKTWLIGFFKKNKDAEMQFMLSFGEKKDEFSDAEISDLIKNTIFSVAGKRKSLAAPEVKKLVDLLEKALQPVEEYLMQHHDRKESIKKFIRLNEGITKYKLTISFSGTRLDNFQQKLTERFVMHINSIKDSGLWEELAADNWSYFLETEDLFTAVFYKFIMEMYHSGSPDQKRYIAELVRDKIRIWMKTGFTLTTDIKEDLLEIIAENGFFTELEKFFAIEKYQNSYNVKVINEILKTDPEKAERTCKKIIDSNSNEKYNSSYYHILEKIYGEKGNLADLAYIKRKRFWEVPFFEDYVFIAENDTDTHEFSVFRSRVLSWLKSSLSEYPEMADFYFAVLDYEKNYKKMLDVIDAYTPTYVINTYAEKLYATHKNKFLMAVRSRSEWGGTEKDDEELAEFLASKYDAGQLEDSFEKKYYGFGSDRFSKRVLSKIKRS